MVAVPADGLLSESLQLSTGVGAWRDDEQHWFSTA